MRYTTDQLRDLAAKATSLFERLAGTVVPDPAHSDEALIESKLVHWRGVLTSEDDYDGLQRRLQMATIDERACRDMLGRVCFAETAALPSWVETLHTILQSAEPPVWAADPSAYDRCLELGTPLPFQEIFIPFVQYARTQTQELPSRLTDQLDFAAQKSLERHLLTELCHIGAVVLSREFRLVRTRENPLAVLCLPTKKTAAPSHDSYRRFVETMLAGGLIEFFQEFPVLAKLLATTVQQWIESTSEFLDRLRADREAIGDLFCEGRNPGKVVGIRPGLSDPHHGQRTVMHLEFASGVEIIYKPKDLSIEKVGFQLLAWFSGRASGLDLKVLTVLDRGRHGWVEYVKPLPCTTRDEVQHYFERAGMLLGLVYALQGTDFHSENLIAHGAHPVLVDLETLMHPRERPWDEKEEETADFMVGDAWSESVLHTGMLPEWEPGRNGKSFDISGLGAVQDQPTGFLMPDWTNVNTDGMTLTPREGVARTHDNCPVLDGCKQLVCQYEDQLTHGFVKAYRTLLDCREELLAENGPLAGLKHRSVRFIFRPTSLYKTILDWLRHPEYLRDGADRSIQIESLAHIFTPPRPPQMSAAIWPIYEAERRSLERSDIPYFLACCTDDALRADGDIISDHFFQEPCYEQARSHLRSLSESDLAIQVGYIRASLYARGAAHSDALAVSRGEPEPEFSHTPAVDTASLIAAAEAIAEEIQANAVYGPDNSTNWISLVADVHTDRLRLKPMGHKLYNGRCGVALFYAALSKLRGHSDYAELALAALHPLRKKLKHPSFFRDLGRRLDLGAGAGLGGIVYALVRIGRFLDHNELLEEAQQAATLITPEKIALDADYDVLTGTAGAILGLLTLREVQGEAMLLSQLTACGQHLLEHRITTRSGGQVWKSPISTIPLTGFSHGAAGISYALTRLFLATGQDRFLVAAQEAIDYENNVYSQEAKNWPDYRDREAGNEDAARFMTTWCHGAPGIGMARLAELDILGSPRVREDIEAALATTLRYSMLNPDHLCCGNLGRAEFMLYAGRRLERPELILEARKRAAWVIERRQRNGAYSLHAAVGAIYSPSFFQGTSGIGYEFLRLADPGTFPSTLMLE